MTAMIKKVLPGLTERIKAYRRRRMEKRIAADKIFPEEILRYF